MTRIIALLLLAILAISCSKEKAQPKFNTKENIAILKNLKEVQWPKAYSMQDTVLLDKILGNDFKMIDASGNWYTKKDELEWIKKNAVVHDSFRYEIKRLEIIENGTAIVCGRGHIINGGEKSIYESSNVLVWRDSLWKAVLSHVSGIKEVK